MRRTNIRFQMYVTHFPSEDASLAGEKRFKLIKFSVSEKEFIFHFTFSPKNSHMVQYSKLSVVRISDTLVSHRYYVDTVCTSILLLHRQIRNLEINAKNYRKLSHFKAKRNKQRT